MKRPARLDRLICRVIGHATDPVDVYNCVCFRCGHEWDDYQDPPRDDIGFWLRWYDLRRRIFFRRFREWLKCPDCGCRLGRHDYDRCIPF